MLRSKYAAEERADKHTSTVQILFQRIAHKNAEPKFFCGEMRSLNRFPQQSKGGNVHCFNEES